MNINDIKKYMKTNKITYSKLAEMTGLSVSTITKIFGGFAKYPRVDTMEAIEKALGFRGDNTCEQSNQLSKRPEYLLSEKFSSEYADLLKDKHFIDTAKLYNAITPEYRALCLGYIAGLLQKHGIDTGRILGY